MAGKTAPPRPSYPIHVNGKSQGVVVSGTQSPSLNVGIGMGYVPSEFAYPDTAVEIEVRGKLFPAMVVKKPFYRKA
jgi:aminomethyltransferase